MASKVSVSCPECFTKLNTDSDRLGKKIKCPKCQEVFTAEAVDDLVDDSFDDDPAPARKSAKGGSKGKGQSGKKSKKGKSAESGSNTLLIVGCIGGGLVVVGAVVALIVFSRPSTPDNSQQAAAVPVAAAPVAAAPATPPPAAAPPTAPAKPTAEKILGLRWFPAETELIAHVKVSELIDAPLLKEALSDPQSKAGFDSSGIEPKDVESITAGLRKLPHIPTRDAFFTTLGNPNQPMMMIMKTKKPIDTKRLMESVPGTAEKEHKGKTYYETPATAFSPANAWWTPEPNVLINGVVNEVRQTIENGEKIVPRAEFTSLNPSPQIIVALVVPELTSDARFRSLEDDATFMKIRKTIYPFSLKLATISVNIKGGFDVQASLHSNNDAGTKNAKTSLEANLAELRKAFESYKETGIPLITELGEMLLSNLKIEEANRTLKLSTNIPDSAQQKLEQLPPVLMMAAMTGGLGGVPGMGAGLGGAGVGGPMTFDGGDMGTQLPGETESVDAVKTEGLADGMTISAKTAWSMFPAMSADGTMSPTIEVMIDVKGNGIDSICGSGGISPTKMTIQGGSLKENKPSFGDSVLPETGFQVYDTSDHSPLGHPEKTLRVKMKVDPPSGSVTKMDLFEGSFKFLTAGESKNLTIEDAFKTAKRPLKGKEFKDADIQLRSSFSNVHPAWITLACGKGHFIGKLQGTPGPTFSMTEVTKDHNLQRIYPAQQDGKFPNNFQLDFTLYSDIKENVVKFRFEDVPLPPIQAQPAMPKAMPQPPNMPNFGPPVPKDPPGVKRDKNGRIIDT